MVLKVLLIHQQKIVLDGIEMFINLTSEMKVIGKANSQLQGLDISEKISFDIVISEFGDEVFLYSLHKTNHKALFFLISEKIESDLKVSFYKTFKVYKINSLVLSGSEIVSLIENIVQSYWTMKQPDNNIIDKNKIGNMVIPFTKQETVILEALASGLSQKGVADKIFVSLRTVQTHISNMQNKTNSSSTNSMILRAVKDGIINIKNVELESLLKRQELYYME